MEADALAYVAITRLQSAYADLATRRAWDELDALAVGDAAFTFTLPTGQTIELVGPRALGEFGRRATEGFSFYSYQPLNTVVDVTDATHASGRSYSLEVGVDASTGDWQEFYGVYDDEYVASDGAWRFA